MSQPFTERANRVLIWARVEALRLGHERIDTEHILLGIVAEQECPAAGVLMAMGIDLSKLRMEVESVVKPGPDKPDRAGSLEFSAAAYTVMRLAAKEASSLGHNYLGSEHLLLGLVSEQRGVAGRILADKGVDLESVREEMRKLLRTGIDDGGRQPCWRGVPALEFLVGLHMHDLTKCLARWPRRGWGISTDADAFHLIGLMDYLSYYCDYDGYGGPRAIKDALDRQVSESIPYFAAALEKYTGQGYGRDVSKWKAWARSKGYGIDGV